MRYCLNKEFNHLYIFNLRGNQRTVGEQSLKEGGKIFGSGSRAPIAINILVKDGSNKHEIFYHDIGDYLSRKQKLDIIDNFGSIEKINWQTIHPDNNNDWVNQRDPNYEKYSWIADDNAQINGVFKNHALGVVTNRDPWVIGFNKEKVLDNSKILIDHYNEERKHLVQNSKYSLNKDSKYIKWTRKLEKSARKNIPIEFQSSYLVETLYRPFTKKYMYYQYETVEETRLYYKKWGEANLAIVTTGRGASREFSTLVTDKVPDMQLLMNSQGFMRFDNEKQGETELLEGNHENINQSFADKLGLSLDDTFAYVYGLLNSPEYQQKYASDLKKDLARIPVVKNKEKYVEIGKKLINLHINYEKVEPYGGCKIEMIDNPSYRVEKMKFLKNRNSKIDEPNDRSTIIFNNDIKISNIPEKAYKYVVNGRSAIEWIMDQYRVKTDKKSGITDDPNDFSDDPKYIFNLLLRIINVSLQTVDLIHQLPKFEVDE